MGIPHKAMPMKTKSLLAMAGLLVFSSWSHSAAIEKSQPVKDKAGLPVKETTEIPPATFYSDQKESLRGLKGLFILVEPLNPEVEKAGISREQLRGEVELKLRQAGIRVFREEQRLEEPGQPYLYINLNAYSWREEVIYGYSFKVDLNQLVILKRDPKIGCFGTTWYSGSAGIIGANKLKSFIRMELADTLDKFINDYSAVNPK